MRSGQIGNCWSHSAHTSGHVHAPRPPPDPQYTPGSKQPKFLGTRSHRTATSEPPPIHPTTHPGQKTALAPELTLATPYNRIEMRIAVCVIPPTWAPSQLAPLCGVCLTFPNKCTPSKIRELPNGPGLQSLALSLTPLTKAKKLRLQASCAVLHSTIDSYKSLNLQRQAQHPRYVKHVSSCICVFFILFGYQVRGGGSPKGLVHNLLMQFFNRGSLKIEFFETCFCDIATT